MKHNSIFHVDNQVQVDPPNYFSIHLNYILSSCRWTKYVQRNKLLSIFCKNPQITIICIYTMFWISLTN